jgi:IstB-like ATP binding protein
MIDRLVHHAEILALKGDSYRLKDRDLARPPRRLNNSRAPGTRRAGFAGPASISKIENKMAHLSTGTTGPHVDRLCSFALAPGRCWVR